MSWVKLDDQFFRHPKAIEAGKDGRALYVAGLCFCASGLTDGWITTLALPHVLADAGVKPSVVRVLERVGLWEESIGSWYVHDYHDFNPKAADVRAARAQRAEAGRRGGLRSKPGSKTEANGEANA